MMFLFAVATTARTTDKHIKTMPTMNNAMLTFVEDDQVDDVLGKVRAMDEETPDLGIRAFVWNVEKYY